MKSLTDLLSLPVVETLGWSLLHFLWQGSLIALIVAIVLWLSKAQHANVRYLVGCTGLALMLTCPIATFSFLNTKTMKASAVRIQPGAEISQLPELNTEVNPNTTQAQPKANPVVLTPDLVPIKKPSWFDGRLKPLLPYLVAFWCLGVFALSLRLLGGLWYVRKLRTHLTKAVSSTLMQQLNAIAERLGLARPVLMRESLAISVPLVIGWLKPMILLPSTVISGLTVTQLEMILAHELAHIRRHDYLVNLVQNVVETLLFYHPLVWWVSAQIRHEREHCCDDMAIIVCGGNRQSYAKALDDLDDLRSHFSLAQAVTGGSLVRRVMRIADRAMPQSLDPRQWVVGLSSIMASLLIFTLIGFNLAFANAVSPITSNKQWTPVSKQDVKGITMVKVPAGSFDMGSTQADIDKALQLCPNCSASDFDYERGGGLQTFSKAYWIDETEVTRADYERCIADGACTPIESTMQSNAPDQPINNLTWNDAARFCTLWRGARLPTEAEWEYAARGPDGLIFPWGNEWNDSFANTKASNAGVTTAVKSYPQGVSWVGAHDMAGNLYEWASSLARPYPFINDERNLTDPNTDPVDPTFSPTVVQRGGSFFDAAPYVRSTYRYNYGLGYHFIGVGFRCVRADANF